MKFDISNTWNDEAHRFVEAHWMQNPYVLIDLQTYGFSGDHINSWIVRGENGAVYAVLYRYYNGIQVVSDSQYLDQIALPIAQLICKAKPEMVQVPSFLATYLKDRLDCYRDSQGFVMTWTNPSPTSMENTQASLASSRDFAEIAELVCSDSEIGQHYSPQLLASQLEERVSIQGCRSMVVRRDGRIVAHMSTYGESSDLAVLGGLKTGQGAIKGDGSKVLTALAASVSESGKTPLLYCYIEALWPWYEKQGWDKTSPVVKFERCNKTQVNS